MPFTPDYSRYDKQVKTLDTIVSSCYDLSDKNQPSLGRFTIKLQLYLIIK